MLFNALLQKFVDLLDKVSQVVSEGLLIEGCANVRRKRVDGVR
jgi:hypothetical protein